MSLSYFPFYPADYEAKTAHLSLEEDGAYNRLLRLCWVTPGCSVPNDKAWIMRRLRVSEDTYDRVVSVVIDEFFKTRRGRLYQAKLTKIYDETSAAHNRRVQAGAKGGRPRKTLENKETSESNAKPMLKQPEPEPEPERKKEKTPDGVLSDPPAIDEIAQAVTAYNSTASRIGWPEVQKITPARRAALRKRLSECGGATGWEFALSKAEASDFLTGQTQKPFLASFDWLTSPSNFTKLLEGNYDNRREPRVQGYNGNNARGGQPSSLAGLVSRLVSDGKI